MRERPGLLGIDFDQTITDGQAAYWDGERAEPDEAVIEALKERYYEGWVIVVWTARPWSQAANVAARMTEWGVPFHGIRCEKGAADQYVDDKTIRPDEFARGESDE